MERKQLRSRHWMPAAAYFDRKLGTISLGVLTAALAACGGGGGGGGDGGPREANRAPVAQIAPLSATQVLETCTALDGSLSSDPDNNTITYVWSIEAAPAASAATLSALTQAQTEFCTDEPGNYTIRLVVNDGQLSSAPAETTFAVAANRPPQANAGTDQAIDVLATVTLDGSGSTDADGQALTYTWNLAVRPAGSTAALSDTSALKPTFVADKPGDYRIRLVVNDGLVSSTADEVIVSTNNVKPVANAGSDIGGRLVGSTVTLNGSASTDADGDALTYSWEFAERPNGSTAALTVPTTVSPSFVIDRAGSYRVRLVVNDGSVNSDPDEVIVNTGNTAPVANAGPDQTVAEDAAVTLSGAGSTDIDGNTLTYSWSFTQRPTGSNATLATPTAVTTQFTPDLAGEYVAQLQVSDGTLQHTDAVTITATAVAVNRPPVANAGPDQSLTSIALVTLDGSASSDPDGDNLTYAWSLTKPTGSASVLAGATTEAPTFTPDLNGEYVAQLIVNDGTVSSAPDPVTINLNHNTQPVAVIGGTQQFFLGQPIALTGSGSSDADGDSLTYAWSVLTYPAGSTRTFSPSNTATNPTLTVNQLGQYQVQLIVNDSKVPSEPVTRLITVVDGDQDGDGLQSSLELANGLNPNDDDSDNDGMLDNAEDSDSDGLSNAWDVSLGYSIGDNDSDNDGITDGNEDFDDDGYSNAVEIAGGFDPKDAGSHPTSFADHVSFEVKQTPVVAGGKIGYVIHVGNRNASQTLSNVVVRLTVPAGVSFSYYYDAHPNANTGCSPCDNGDEVLWNLGNLEPGDSASIDINASVGAAVTAGTSIQTSVQVTANGVGNSVNLARTASVVASQPVFFALAPSKDPVAPGESFSYQLDLGNASNATLTGSSLSLTLPAGVTFNSASDGGTHSSNVVTWNVGSVNAGASLKRTVSVTLANSATEASVLNTVAQLRHDGGLELDRELQASVTVSAPLPLNISYTLAQSPVAAGGNLRYIISVNNVSEIDTINNAVVMLRVPAGVSFSYYYDAHPDAATGCSPCDSGDEVHWTLGNLAPGASRSIEINATVAAATAAGTLLHTPVFVTADGLGDTINLVRTASVVATQPVYLALAPSKDPVAPGESFSYQLDLGNASNAAITGSSVSLALPAGMTVNSISDGGTQNGNVVSWNVGSVNAGASVKRTVNVTLANSAIEASVLNAVAQLRHDGGLELDRELQASVTVSAPLLLNVSYTLAQSPVAAGGNLRYIISVNNTSEVNTINNAEVMLRVPAGVSFSYYYDAHPDAATGCSPCDNGDEVHWTLGNLAPGASRSIEVNATVAAATAAGTLLHTPVFVTADGLGDTINLVRTASVVATQPVFFALAPSKDPVAPGESFSYQLDLGNAGSNAITGSSVSLTLPAGVTFNSASDGGTHSSNVVTWNVGSVNAGASVKRTVNVTLANSAIEASVLNAVAQLRHDGGLELDRELQASVTVSAPLLLNVSYTLEQSPVAAGGNLRYIISVNNTSEVNTINNAVVMLRVPVGVSFSYYYDAHPDATTGCSPCDNGDEVHWTLGNLAPGASRSIEVNATVAAATAAGTLLHTPLFVTADGLGDSISLVRTASVVATQPVFFALAPSKDPVAPGESFSYQLELGNAGSNAITGSSVSLTLPAGVTFNSASDGGTHSSNVVTWNVGSVNAGASVKRTVNVTLANSATEASVLNAAAQLRHDGGLELDRELQASVTVSAPLLLNVSYTLTQSTVAAGGNLHYTITVNNISEVSTINNVTVMLRVPNRVSFSYYYDAVPIANTGCSPCDNGDEVFWNLGNLAPGASASIEVDATVAAATAMGTLLHTPVFVTADGLGDSINLVRTAVVGTP